MDALFFQTFSKADVLSELQLHQDSEKKEGNYFNGSTYQGEDFIFSWIGRIVNEWEDVIDKESGQLIPRPKTFMPGYYFNIWVSGQEALDRFCNLSSANRIEPLTPNLTLF